MGSYTSEISKCYSSYSYDSFNQTFLYVFPATILTNGYL